MPDLGVLLCKIHRHLTCSYIITLTAAAGHCCGGNVEMIANRIKNVVYRQRLIIYLNRPLYHSLRKAHVNLAVVNHRESQQRVDDTLKSAHAVVSRLRNEINHVSGMVSPSRLILLLRMSTQS